MAITREQLKGGERYKCDSGGISEVIFIGKEHLIYIYTESVFVYELSGCISSFLSKYSIIEKPKKRYWIWDIKRGDLIYKHDYYMDEEGRKSTGETYTAGTLVRKHENEFIEIEVE